MRIDHINEDGRAIPVRPAPSLHDLSLDDPSIILEANRGGRGDWMAIRMTPSLRLRLAPTRLARLVSAEGRVGKPAWYVLGTDDRRLKALAALWKTEVCLAPDELLLALQDPTGQVKTALTQPWKASVIEAGKHRMVEEADVKALLAPEGLACIGLERYSGALPEIDLYLAEI